MILSHLKSILKKSVLNFPTLSTVNSDKVFLLTLKLLTLRLIHVYETDFLRYFLLLLLSFY